MPINERNIEISGELVTDINEDTGKTEAYFILKFIIDLHNKKVHVFDVDAMKKATLYNYFVSFSLTNSNNTTSNNYLKKTFFNQLKTDLSVATYSSPNTAPPSKYSSDSPA